MKQSLIQWLYFLGLFNLDNNILLLVGRNLLIHKKLVDGELVEVDQHREIQNGLGFFDRKDLLRRTLKKSRAKVLAPVGLALRLRGNSRLGLIVPAQVREVREIGALLVARVEAVSGQLENEEVEVAGVVFGLEVWLGHLDF